MVVFWFAVPCIASAQDPGVGRELFEREWEFVERAPAIEQSDFIRPMPHREQFGDRGRRHGRQRGPRPGRHDRGVDPVLMFAAEGAVFFADGLGPLYNAVSCAECHPNGGASGVEHNVTTLAIDPRSPLLNEPAGRGDREAALSSAMDLFPGLVSANTLNLHAVVHDHSARPGYETIRQQLDIGVAEGIAPEWFSPKERTVRCLRNAR